MMHKCIFRRVILWYKTLCANSGVSNPYLTPAITAGFSSFRFFEGRFQNIWVLLKMFLLFLIDGERFLLYNKNLLNKVNRYLEKNENICELKKSAKQDGG